MNKRSLTLLETLIALVLVIALGALIFPSLMHGIDERSFESAADITNEQLMMARAHAQATGSPVEVTYSAKTSQVQARLFAPWLVGIPSLSQPSERPGANRSFVGGAGEHEESNAINLLIGESWACRSLGRGMRIGLRPPTAPANSSAGAAASSAASGVRDYETFEDLGKGQDVRLAVFMPDGSALTGEPVWINDDKGRCGKLTINPWSGLPIFQRLVDGELPSADDEDGASKPVSGDAETKDRASKKGDNSPADRRGKSSGSEDR